MATMVEARLELTLTLTRDGGGKCIAAWSTYTDDGTRVRSGERDITGQLSAPRRQGLLDLFLDVEAALKTHLGIP